MNFSQQQALLAQQNGALEALERRRERERAAMAQRSDPAAGRALPPRVPEDDDSGDEVDQISTRTLAIARYKRNHDWMNEVFHHAAFSQKATQAKPRSAYSIFTTADLKLKTGTLQAEIETLQARVAQRRADKIREAQSVQDSGDVSMGGIGEPITV
jgi:hypothetical protein